MFSAARIGRVKSDDVGRRVSMSKLASLIVPALPATLGFHVALDLLGA